MIRLWYKTHQLNQSEKQARPIIRVLGAQDQPPADSAPDSCGAGQAPHGGRVRHLLHRAGSVCCCSTQCTAPGRQLVANIRGQKHDGILAKIPT